jgi:hypothetical protein
MENQDSLLTIIFILTAFLTIGLFYRASQKSILTLFILLPWLIFQSVLSLGGYYHKTQTGTPRLLFMIGPPVVLIIILFVTHVGRRFIDRLDPAKLVLIFIIRIPVELVLYGLFLDKMIPKGMSFAGGNLDIFSGLSAPLIYYFGFQKKLLNTRIVLLWNFICLGLLLVVVIHAILAAPSPFQQLNFDQPNLAILYFPYTLLPSLVVPLVLFSQLALFRILRHHPPSRLTPTNAPTFL